MEIKKDILSKVNEWLTPTFDQQTQEEIKEMITSSPAVGKFNTSVWAKYDRPKLTDGFESKGIAPTFNLSDIPWTFEDIFCFEVSIDIYYMKSCEANPPRLGLGLGTLVGSQESVGLNVWGAPWLEEELPPPICIILCFRV